jgi:hypothetical protein
MYTPTITVGINYAPGPDESKPFDILYLYGTKRGATPRDLFQSSLRCRQLTSNHLVFFLNNRSGGPPENTIGLEAWDSKLTAVAERNSAAARDVLARIAAQPTGRYYDQAKLDALALYATGTATTLPDWFRKLLVVNLNEAAISTKFAEELYNHYLVVCGYVDVTPPNQMSTEDALMLPPGEPVMRYDDVPRVGTYTSRYRRIEQSIKDGVGIVTMTDRLILRKAHFHARLGLPCDFAWTTFDAALRHGDQFQSDGSPWLPPEWATAQNMDELWRGLGTPAVAGCAEGCALVHDHVIAVEASGYDGGYLGLTGTYKNISIEKAGEYAAIREDCYAGNKTAYTGVKGYAQRLIALTPLLKALGVENSCEAKSWSAAEWENIAGAVNTASTDALNSFDMGSEALSPEDRKRTPDPAKVAAKNATRILSAWSGSTIAAAKAEKPDRNQFLSGEGNEIYHRLVADASFCPGLPKKERETQATLAKEARWKELVAAVPMFSLVPSHALLWAAVRAAQDDREPISEEALFVNDEDED